MNTSSTYNISSPNDIPPILKWKESAFVTANQFLAKPTNKNTPAENATEIVLKWGRSVGVSSITPCYLGGILEVRDREEVIRIILEEPYLDNLIREATKRIMEHLPNSHLSLEYFLDPEEGWEQVVMGINTGLEVEKAIDYYNNFTESWWVKEVPRSKGKLVINLEFTDVL